MKIAVIADDFTGANDVGVQLNRHGINVISAIEEVISGDVIVYNTESRNIDGKTAKEVVYNQFKKMKKGGFDYFYKKIDSTLRGNLLEEIEAIVESIDEQEKLVIAVAFPSMGRVIKNGEHFLNGQKLMETEIAKDPVAPVKEGNLKRIFKESILISATDIKNGIAKDKIKNSKERIVIFDSETEEELKEVAKFIVKIGVDKYIIGSAGIMNYLPEFWGIENRVAVISGSCSSVSIKQMDEFIKKNIENIELAEFNIENKENRKSYKVEKDLIIRSIKKRDEMEIVFKKFESDGISRSKAGDIISDYIADESVKYILENSIKNIVILGGETSYKILKKLEIKGLKIEFEIETGIAVAKSENMRYNIIVKPGNFGSKECINRCYDILKKRKI